MSQAVPAGYSGKPVWQKLGLTPALRVRVLHAPGDYAALVGLGEATPALVGTHAAFDLAHLFAREAAQLARDVHALAAELPAHGVIWVSWPKKAAKVPTDITEDSVRAVALPLGLVDVKVCAVDAVWSGLKLVWRRERRAAKSEAAPPL
ncbi:MAG: DUF3052 domain-containing protein [Rhodanobacteraceae bacterium]|jgi:hypothetical protein|nr:DUF3052 domain-containing protein [Rhodanobacteraceae bacterium]